MKREPMPTLGSAMAMGYRYPLHSHIGGREERERDRERAVVALNASKEIETQSVEWALSNVACRPGDRIILLAILSSAPANAGKKLWGMPLLSRDCRRAEVVARTNPMGQDRLSASASRTIHRLCTLCHAKEVNVEVRVVPEAANGITTAMEAAKSGATWIVLDGQLKKEVKWCTEQLSCNVVLVDRSNAKILRLNLNPASVSDQLMPSKWDKSHKKGAAEASTATSTSPDLGGPSSSSSTTTSSSEPGMSPPLLLPLPLPLPLPAPASAFSPASSSWRPSVSDSVHRQSFVPELRTTRQEDTASDTGTVAEVISDYNSDDSYPISESPEATPHSNPIYAKRADNVLRAVKKQSLSRAHKEGYLREVSMVPRPCSALSSRRDRVIDPISPLPLMDSGRLSFGSWKEASGQGKFAGFNQEDKMRSTAHLHLCRQSSARRGEGTTKRVVTTKDLLEKLNQWDQEGLHKEKDLPEYTSSSVRQVMALTRKMPAGPPPLCSICQHKVPIFGKPPRRFGYAELEVATAGFSWANFLAEGGFGSVHRGVLPDGQPVAVKQHKPASSQGDVEFCAEVEVLSCAQHRNVVMLIGYCVEENHRLLVYEFICNGSLDSHLYGKSKSTLEWSSRQKIALGAVRGLRYLHEECRVGCIVHRDMRPNNILLTHDFEPMVGDFGLARWQPNGDLGEQTRVIGTFGYLAPEYIQSGEITEKADVYSFGVVLLELVTGRKAIDINRPKGQQCLTEWARPLLVELAIQDLIDPDLGGWYSNYEVYCMLHAASLCISKDPHLRPRMSQVLRILEGDIILDKNGSSKPNFGHKSFSTDPALSYHQRSDHVLLPPPVDYSAWPWIQS